MKALVLGGAGFIGYHLCKRLLDDGHEVCCVDDFSRGHYDNDFANIDESSDLMKFDRLDLTIEDIFVEHYETFQYYRPGLLLGIFREFNPDVIFHLLAVNGTKNFYGKSCEVLEVNVLSLIYVLRMLNGEKYKGKFIWTSSSEVYAGNVDNLYPTPEVKNVSIEDVYNPRWSYAGSKIIGELLCINYSRQYDLDINIVRPHNIYGPRMGYDHVIPEFILRVLEKEDPFKIYGNSIRSFCYVDDFVEGLMILSKLGRVEDTIFNIGDDRFSKDMYSMAVRIYNRINKFDGCADYDPVVEILGLPEGSTNRRCPDITKMRKLGYDPKIMLDEGLERTIGWYKNDYKKKIM